MKNLTAKQKNYWNLEVFRMGGVFWHETDNCCILEGLSQVSEEAFRYRWWGGRIGRSVFRITVEILTGGVCPDIMHLRNSPGQKAIPPIQHIGQKFNESMKCTIPERAEFLKDSANQMAMMNCFGLSETNGINMSYRSRMGRVRELASSDQRCLGIWLTTVEEFSECQ